MFQPSYHLLPSASCETKNVLNPFHDVLNYKCLTRPRPGTIKLLETAQEKNDGVDDATAERT
jgi:hypothetical protein